MNADDADRKAATPPAAPAAPVAASQRERLLDGMARTVASQGYAATSVADVLREAGISRRTFYERFADKEDCFLAAYDAFVERCSAHVRATFHAAGTWEEGVEQGLRALLDALAREPAFARLSVVEVLAAGPRGLARRDATLRCFATFLDGGSARGDGPSAPPPDVVVQAIVGGVHELVYSSILREQTVRLPALGTELLHYTFMLLGSAPQRG